MTRTRWHDFARACTVIQIIPGPTVLTVVAWSLARRRIDAPGQNRPLALGGGGLLCGAGLRTLAVR